MAGHPRCFSLLLDSHPPFAESTLGGSRGECPPYTDPGTPTPFRASWPRADGTPPVPEGRARLRQPIPRSAGPRSLGSRLRAAEECGRAGAWPWCLVLIFSGLIVFTGACGEGRQQGSAHGNVLTAEQVPASKPDEPVNFGGTIVATGSGPDSRMGWRSGGPSTSGIWARR